MQEFMFAEVLLAVARHRVQPTNLNGPDHSIWRVLLAPIAFCLACLRDSQAELCTGPSDGVEHSHKQPPTATKRSTASHPAVGKHTQGPLHLDCTPAHENAPRNNAQCKMTRIQVPVVKPQLPSSCSSRAVPPQAKAGRLRARLLPSRLLYTPLQRCAAAAAAAR